MREGERRARAGSGREEDRDALGERRAEEREARASGGRERERDRQKEKKRERTTHSILLFILSGKTKESDERLLRHARTHKRTLNFQIRL